MANNKMTPKQVNPISQIRATLESPGMMTEIKKALPQDVSVDRFIRIAVTAINGDPKLLSADKRSLYNSCLQAAADGLLPDGREAAFVTFGGQVKYMPMIAGICKKASGSLETLDAQVVYEKDQYEAWIDEEGQHFKHVRARGDRGKVLLTYAYARTKKKDGGGLYFEEIDETQMQAIEQSARSKGGPWTGPFRDEMRRKSAIRRLAKYRLPNTSEIDDVVRRDDDLYDLSNSGKEEKPTEKKGASRLKDIIETQEIDESTTSTTAATEPVVEEPPI